MLPTDIVSSFMGLLLLLGSFDLKLFEMYVIDTHAYIAMTRRVYSWLGGGGGNDC